MVRFLEQRFPGTPPNARDELDHIIQHVPKLARDKTGMCQNSHMTKQASFSEHVEHSARPFYQ